MITVLTSDVSLERPAARERFRRLRRLEGRQVIVALRNKIVVEGTLVSAGREMTSSVWLVADGVDVFVAADDIVDLSDAVPERAQAHEALDHQPSRRTRSTS